MRKLTNGSNDSDSTEDVENDRDFSGKEYAVSIRGGRYIDTYLAEDDEDAAIQAFEENDFLIIENEVSVTEMGTGDFTHVYLEDVVDTTPDEPWERGEGDRFGRLQHTDPENVQAVVETLRNSTSDITGIEKLVDEVERVSHNLTDGDFECPVCGLSHGHPIEKHDVREIYGVTDLFANSVMQFNPLCHCGLHELSRLVGEYDGEVDIFEDGPASPEKEASIKSATDGAPVPNSVIQSLDARFGL